MSSKGIRLNNPGCIRKGDRWQGLASPPDDGEFCRFDTPAWGIRAIARILITYQDKRLAEDGSAIDTVREIIERWAPPNENDTESYINSVLTYTGIVPGTHINVHKHDECASIVKAIIHHENGMQPYTAEQIDRGLMMAGIEPKKQPKKPTVVAAQVGGVGALGSLALEHFGEIRTAMPLVQQAMDKAPWILGALILGAFAWVIWTQFRATQRGL